MRFNRIVWKSLPPCKTIVALISAARDRKLTVRETIILKLHLASCVPCVNYLDQIEFVHQVMHHHIEQAIENDQSITMSDGAKQRIRNQLKAALPPE